MTPEAMVADGGLSARPLARLGAQQGSSTCMS